MFVKDDLPGNLDRGNPNNLLDVWFTMNINNSIREPEDSSRRTSSDRRLDDVEEYADILPTRSKHPNGGR